MTQNNERRTRYLGMDPAEPMAGRTTSPLEIMPWVIEFRVVGTPHLIKVPITSQMLMGRPDPEDGISPEIDLSAYGAQILGVSRRHAMITARNHRISVQDLGSPNGTYINDSALTPDREYRLHNGDQLRLGRLKLQVHFVVEPVSTGDLKENDVLEAPLLGSGQRVLVVDDDPYVTSLLQSILTSVGFTVQVCDSITAAITHIEERTPDIVITELLLGEMEGLNLIRYLRSRTPQTGCSVVIMSSVTGGSHFKQAEALADVFIPKPLTIDDLIRALDKLMARSR